MSSRYFRLREFRKNKYVSLPIIGPEPYSKSSWLEDNHGNIITWAIVFYFILN